MRATDADTTRAIKAALRKAFPSAKFSVTRGGKWVEWNDDGPEVAAVEDALIAAKCAQPRIAWNGQRYLDGPEGSIYFCRYNVAEREKDKADSERHVAEYEEEKRRENDAVVAARAARETIPRPKAEPRAPIENQAATFEAFEQLRQRAERDVAERKHDEKRPSWGPRLIIEGEMLAISIELGLMTADEPPVARLWAEFADPTKRGSSVRDARSRHALTGLACRGFELTAGAERGSPSDVILRAQREASGAWRFGPNPSSFEYSSHRSREWGEAVRSRERYRQQEDVVARLTSEIAAIEARDRQDEAKFYRRQQLRNRATELAMARVLDFAGAPGLQMQLAARLSGRCSCCGKELIDPISLERGIGPDCYAGKVSFVRFLAKKGYDASRIAYLTGMPEVFAIAVMAEPAKPPKQPRLNLEEEDDDDDPDDHLRFDREPAP
jgi:Family of unknown function (DUF6011)